MPARGELAAAGRGTAWAREARRSKGTEDAAGSPAGYRMKKRKKEKEEHASLEGTSVCVLLQLLFIMSLRSSPHCDTFYSTRPCVSGTPLFVVLEATEIQEYWILLFPAAQDKCVKKQRAE